MAGAALAGRARCESQHFPWGTSNPAWGAAGTPQGSKARHTETGEEKRTATGEVEQGKMPRVHPG